MVSVDHMLISILYVPVEALEMSFAVVAEALAPRSFRYKPDALLMESLPSDVLPQESKLVLYPTLMFSISFGACPDFNCISFL